MERCVAHHAVAAQLFDLVDEVLVQHRRRIKTSVLNEVGRRVTARLAGKVRWTFMARTCAFDVAVEAEGTSRTAAWLRTFATCLKVH